jgi:hypothetical protein
MKRAIVSLATRKGNYVKALNRLEESLRGDENMDFIGFIDEHSVGAPLHVDNPYAFKIFAIEQVKNQGYDQVMWLDSSVFAIANTKPVWDIIDRSGYLMQDAGFRVGNYCNDSTLHYFDVTRNEAIDMFMYGNAGMLGLDFANGIANEFFNQWKRSMINGCFKGEWNNTNKTESQDERCWGHRHDMSAGSIIANKLKMEYQSGNNILDYSSPYKQPKNETIIFYAQGL